MAQKFGYEVMNVLHVVTHIVINSCFGLSKGVNTKVGRRMHVNNPQGVENVCVKKKCEWKGTFFRGEYD